MKIKEQPVKKKKKGLSAKRRRRAGDEDEAEEERQREEKRGDEEAEGEEEEEKEPPVDPLAGMTPPQLTEALVTLLQPGETVSAGLRRLGGLGGRRKKGRARADEEEEQKEDEVPDRDPEKLERLTALADRLVAMGEYEIYQQTYEKLTYRLKSSAHKVVRTQGERQQGDDDELDMFGDQFDERLGREKETRREEEEEEDTMGNNITSVTCL